MCDEIESNIIKDIFNLEERTPKTAENYATIREVIDYISGMSYLKQETSLVRLKAYIANDFDYDDTLQDLANQGINTNYNALRQSIHYANKILKQKLGDNIVRDLKRDYESVQSRLTLLEIDVNDLLLSDTLKSLPAFQCFRYDLKDCVYELLFLARFSKSSFDLYRGKMDSKKLAYLNHLLTSPSTSETELSLVISQWLSKAKLAHKEDVLPLLNRVKALNDSETNADIDTATETNTDIDTATDIDY